MESKRLESLILEKLDKDIKNLESKLLDHEVRLIKSKEKIIVLEEAFIITNELLLRQSTINTDLCARVKLLEKRVKKLENRK